jgi:hypothetical protein
MCWGDEVTQSDRGSSENGHLPQHHANGHLPQHHANGHFPEQHANGHLPQEQALDRLDSTAHRRTRGCEARRMLLLRETEQEQRMPPEGGEGVGAVKGRRRDCV